MMTETVVNVQEAPNNNAAKTNASTTTESPLGWIKVNVDYFKTIPGLLKIAEFILGILCMALASPAYGAVHFFLFVVTTSFISCVIWIAIYLLGIREALASLPINWILTELLNTGISAFFYIIAFICQLIASISYNNHHGTYIAAAVFGALNTLVYCGATFLLRIEWKSGNTTN